MSSVLGCAPDSRCTTCTSARRGARTSTSTRWWHLAEYLHGPLKVWSLQESRGGSLRSFAESTESNLEDTLRRVLREELPRYGVHRKPGLTSASRRRASARADAGVSDESSETWKLDDERQGKPTGTIAGVTCLAAKHGCPRGQTSIV